MLKNDPYNPEFTKTEKSYLDLMTEIPKMVETETISELLDAEGNSWYFDEAKGWFHIKIWQHADRYQSHPLFTTSLILFIDLQVEQHTRNSLKTMKIFITRPTLIINVVQNMDVRKCHGMWIWRASMKILNAQYLICLPRRGFKCYTNMLARQ